MRKLTSLLMLLSLFVGTAWAQDADPFEGKMISTVGESIASLEDIDETGWYVLYNNGRKACVSEETTAFKMRDNVQVGDFASSVKGKLFQFTKQTDGIYYIKSGNGLYFQFKNNNASEVSTDPVMYKVCQIGDNAGYYYIQHASNNYVADGQDKNYNFVCWETTPPTAASGNACYTILPVEIADYVDVSYNYYLDGNLVYTHVVQQLVGSDVAAPQYGYISFTAPTGTVSNDNKSFDIQCTLDETLPFTVTTDLDNPVWQVVEMHRNGTRRFWEYNASSNGKIDVVDYQANMYDVVADNKLWCFVGNAVAGFRIYNKAVGTGSTLNATSGNATIGTATDGNDVWHLAASTYVTDATNVACFTQDASSYMNQNGGKIAYWEDADNGSTCYFFQPEDIALPAASSVNDWIDAIPSDVTNRPESAIGVLDANSDAVNQFQTQYAALSAEGATPTVDELIALGQSANKIYASVAPTAGYYYIYATGYRYKEGTGEGNNESWRLTYEDSKCYARPLADGKNLGPEHVWYFDPADNGFKLKACNLDKYLVLKAAAPVSEITSDFQNGHKFVFASDGAGRFTIKNGDGNVLRTEQAGDVNYWSGENYETWYIVPAEKLSVTVSDAAGYATIHLPFDVKLPEDGSVKAYAATSVGTSAIILTPKEDIPANQGAILEGAGTHELSIVKAGEATSDWNGNNLDGTNVDTPIQGQAYVLSMQNGTVGMYRTALNLNEDGIAVTDGSGTHFLNNANKAYLSKESKSRFLLFDFGTETGIGNIEGTEDAATGKAAIYDLSGRRVSNAGKGIYIVNGKKVVK